MGCMIKRKTLAKRKRKNPYIYDYGYHFTRESLVSSILQNGIRVKKDNFSLNKLFYNGTRPIYLSSSPNLKNLSAGSKDYLTNKDINYVLKINIKNLNQEVDLNSLLERDSGFGIDNIIYDGLKIKNNKLSYVYSEMMPVVFYKSYMDYYETVIDEEDGVKYKTRIQKFSFNSLNKKPLLKKWFEIYNSGNVNSGGIPLIDFKNNESLALDTIITTSSMAICENIPSENIVDYWKVK
jgi:hypothetical protein